MIKIFSFKPRFLLTIFCILFLANGCKTSRREPQQENQPVAMVSQQDSTRYYKYHIIFPDSVSPPAAADSMRSYAQRNKRIFMEMQPTDTSIYGAGLYELRVEFKKVFQSPRFISYVGNTYLYTGGAHGRSSVKTLNFDLNKGHFITLDSLFRDTTGLRPISSYARHRIITKVYKKASEPNLQSFNKKWVARGTAPIIKNYVHFHPARLKQHTAAGIEIIFTPYQVGPHYIGMPHIFIPDSIFYNYLKLEYQTAFKNP